MPDSGRPLRYEIRREAATRSELQALGWNDSDMHERPGPESSTPTPSTTTESSAR
jgi:hypothetical protein